MIGQTNIDFSLSETIEFSGYVFDSKLDKQGSNDNYDWGLAIEILSADDSIRFGASYLSDLAETDDRLLDEDIKYYQNKVAGLAMHLLVGFGPVEITTEIVRATEKFRDMESGFDSPSAENIELAYFASQRLQFALRIGHSRELEDEPEWQYGLSASWLLAKGLSCSLDIIHGHYKNNFAFDDEGNEFNYRNEVGALLTYEF